MSHRKTGSVRSGCIENAIVFENKFTPKWIANRSVFNQIDVTAEDSSQFLDHVDPVIRRPWRVLLKCGEDVNIAFRAEILAQRGTEESKFTDSIFDRSLR